jgi:fused signal recognition particle receptor
VTPETLWIVLAVVAAVVLLAVGAGLLLRRRRTISLRRAQELEQRPGTAPPRRGGTYKAESGFSFSAGTDTDTETPPAPPAPPRPAPGDVTLPDAPRPPVAPPTTPAATAPPAEAPPATAPPATAPAPADAAPADAAPAPPTDATPRATGSHAAQAFVPGPAVDGAPFVDPVAPTPTEELAPAEPEVDPLPPAPPVDAPDPQADPVPRASGSHAAQPFVPGPAVDGVPFVDPAAPAPPEETRVEEVPPGEVRPEEAAALDAIAPPQGRLERLRGQLARSQSAFGQGLLGLLGAGELDEESWEDVEATLLQADLGPEMTSELVETLREQLAVRAVRTPEEALRLLRDVLTAALVTEADRSVRALPHDGRPAVLLVVGVNGTGKTTTTGKLARVLVASGRHVVLGAADTFRAAAAEQLATWGERAGATVVRGPEGADPASVAFDAVKQGAEEGADAVLLDTAGRLHTKTGLMDELQKVKRVVERQAEVDEVLLVLDATTGQNGLTQARVFGDVVKVTGIVLTKLDGTAKGGIVFRVQRELGVPVKLVGLGEGPDDLAPFEPAAYVDALLT